MILFRFRAWPAGPNLLSAGLYVLRGWHTLILWPLNRHAIPVRLPVRARLYK